ncbi:MAG: hypothetical protein ABI193_12090 [Minicystis sp.]
MSILTEPSDRILEETPARTLKFLGAVSTNAHIHAALVTRGYSKEVHDRGWDLMLTASGYRKPRAVVLNDPAAAAAIAELDAWDEPNFRIALAALADDFPEQATFVFDDLEPSTGAGAIVSVKTFLDRLDTLESGKDRKATRKVDHAALEKLAKRGFPAAERARLRKLIEVGLGAPEPATTDAGDVPTKDTDPTEQRAAKRALWGWLNEWTEIARAVIKRRDWLIQLGLAKRKARKGGDAKTGAGGQGGTGGGEPG